MTPEQQTRRDFLKKSAFDLVVKPAPGIYKSNEDEQFYFRHVLMIDYTAAGAVGGPFFSINDIDLPFSRARLHRFRANQEFSNAAGTFFGRFLSGIQVRFDQDPNIFPVATGTVGGASTPGTTLGNGFPTMRINIPPDMNGMMIPDLGYMVTNKIEQINVQLCGDTATVAPAGTLVAVGDQIRIRLEMTWKILEL